MREVTHHKAGPDSRALHVRVEAGGGVRGSAPATYRLTDDAYSVELHFMTLEAPVGLTNESLLAVVQDRLECLQEGEFPCPENEEALTHLRRAMAALHARTARRVRLGIEGRAEEEVVEKKRVWVDGDTLRVDAGQSGANFPVAALKTGWGPWQAVEGALRHLDPPVTAEELLLLGGLAETPAARNGVAELRSALANSPPRPVRPGGPA